MREIVLDTETTGFDPASGHRLVEIGCIELLNHMPTGRVFHKYVNPERDMPEEAFAVHGLSADFLSQHPVFAEIVADLREFIGTDSQLIIHNAEFDMRFLNYEFGLLGFPPLPMSRATDTVAMARRRFPGAPASLDALCRRFEIDNSQRTRHGALLDAELLAEVYLELIGGREPVFELAATASKGPGAQIAVAREYREPRPHQPTGAEIEAHAAFVGKLKNPIWAKLEEKVEEAVVA